MLYEEILIELENHNIEIVEKKLAGNLKALYCDNTIVIDKRLSITEKKCILAEELGHHFKNYGDILNKNNINCVKQESIGRRWGYEYLLPYHNILTKKEECSSLFELAEKLDVTQEFLEEAISYYQTKIGIAL